MFDPYSLRWGLIADGDPITTPTATLFPVLWRGRPAMLKLSSQEDQQRGAEMMEWWNGDGAAQALPRQQSWQNLTCPTTTASISSFRSSRRTSLAPHDGVGYSLGPNSAGIAMTEKEALVYQQNCEEFRSLNGFFWQIPLIMMTLNGGLWYSVASLDLGLAAQRGILVFASFANFVMVLGLKRIRDIMEHLLVSIRKFQGTEKPPGRSRVVQRLFQSLLALAACGALMAAYDPSRHFVRPTSTSAALSPEAPPISTAEQTGTPAVKP